MIKFGTLNQIVTVIKRFHDISKFKFMIEYKTADGHGHHIEQETKLSLG